MPIRPSGHKRFLQEDVKSNSSSRSASRVRTPKVDGEENGSLDVNFQSIEELLTMKLESLQSLLEKQGLQEESTLTGNSDAQDHKQKSISHLNQARIQSGLTTINDIIHSLSMSRTEVSSQSREMLLAQLYKLIVSKPLVVYNEEHAGTSSYVSDDKVLELIKVLTSGDYRSPSEFLLLFRSCIALLASDIEEFGDLISPEFLNLIQKLIQDPTTQNVNSENKASVITGSTALLMILHNGSSSYGIDDRVTSLIELSEGYSASSNTLTAQLKSGEREHSTFFAEEVDKKIVNDSVSQANSEAAVAIAALHAAGCLLTLFERGDYLNDYVADTMPKLVALVDNDNIEIAKAAGRVIALCYEIFTYDNSGDADDESEYNDNSPYYEQEELTAIIERLANFSTHKITKKSKKETHSIFRDILNTITNYTTYDKRIEILKKSPEGVEIINSLMDSNYIKLSKSRSLSINSWFLYLRLIHLKWCFSFGVHNQLVSNDSIRDILKEPPTDYQLKYGGNDTFADEDYDDSFNTSGLSDKFANDDKKRTEQIRKARVNKLAETINDLEIK
ncbi:uncharacterized protein AC631_04709 [Debaryomyces fabryi]|uniref:Interferon-related developmental regulator N-terminal domain-containing protein n=1 Tax=Debaryomyces fabryi TaxID=58627 RepID=A0A0V1PTN2_9ASCO|nr:uncharacterized protein AC631_04709 [Debaryomyces fabryi]KRZ99519.1 hypothetical protein AC631_04709 [Debaryomyces fabryi]CUM46468.1 unnamed protein product [Debaryomyces fabryi]